ncbi:ester cyclase [Rhizobium tropici]|uniref:Ester cyclase n=1 Tax=Rhizobium tropici TaxID=398 RepID=A0A5B0WA95_RHITR|nr:ester cyclase [Rhizobium tropici]KAA1183954.1 ester cyclase [Rhizobium tropici]
MTAPLSELYQEYIDCLNTRDWDNLANYVDTDVAYNGKIVGFDAYRQAREKEAHEIPDLYYKIHILVSDDNTVASRLEFDISPTGEFLGLPVNGQLVSFCENVFYEYNRDKIGQVWSVLDKAAIEAQLFLS